MRIHSQIMGVAAMIAAASCCAAAAADRRVMPGDNVEEAIAAAAEDDVILLARGEHRARIFLRKRVVLAGEQGSLLIGPGTGSVISVHAPGAIVRGLTIRGSGSNLDAFDAGVYLEQDAPGAIVENNRIEGNLYGVVIHGAADSIVRDNIVTGRTEGRVNDRGNGVSVWNAPGAKVTGNHVSQGRDGIFSVTSRLNQFSNNTFENVRFAVHYMYTNDSEISGNISIGNTVGYAIMYSNRLKVAGNRSDGDRDNGLLFNYANGSDIRGNSVIGRLLPAERWLQGSVSASEAREHGLAPAESNASELTGPRPGPGKCVFIYNANRNRFTGNRFEGCEIGVHFTAGSEQNDIHGNSFIRNRTQVKYVGTRYLDWSKDGRGNFWSDNPAFDLDGDGIADNAYRPNDVMDKVLWTTPQAKLLANSPAVQVVRWAQSQFPAILPGGVVDKFPLMSAPEPRP